MDDTDKPNPDPPQQEFLTVKQVAEYPNISAASVYGLCVTGKLSHYRLGEGRGAIRINRVELLEFVQRCRVEEKHGQHFVDLTPRSPKLVQYQFKHLDLRPSHACGANSKAGKPCPNLTKEERCHLHQKVAQKNQDQKASKQVLIEIGADQ